jgi:hypothetical protein
MFPRFAVIILHSDSPDISEWQPPDPGLQTHLSDLSCAAEISPSFVKTDT